MARVADVRWKAVGASLDDLARTVRTASTRGPEVFAYANSGVLKEAGGIVLARYMVPGDYMETTNSGTPEYTAPPGGTHGPVRFVTKDANGNSLRNDKGQFVRRPVEGKLFVKGKFVSRSGAMQEAAKDLSLESPSAQFPRKMASGEVGQRGKNGEIAIGIDERGNGYVLLVDGYAAAEKGTRKRLSSPVRGWWRGIRSVYGRWGTMLKKKYPDLLKIEKASVR